MTVAGSLGGTLPLGQLEESLLAAATSSRSPTPKAFR